MLNLPFKIEVYRNVLARKVKRPAEGGHGYKQRTLFENSLIRKLNKILGGIEFSWN